MYAKIWACMPNLADNFAKTKAQIKIPVKIVFAKSISKLIRKISCENTEKIEKSLKRLLHVLYLCKKCKLRYDPLSANF